jgi:hypothetical protein
MMKYLSLIVLFTLSGCSTLKNVSGEVPYDFLLGAAFTTRPTFLCDDTQGFFKPAINAKLTINHGFEKCINAKHIAVVPEGAAIELKKVVKHTGYGLFIVKRWYVIGEFVDGNNKYDFIYSLPWIQYQDGQYMPLESKDVPWKNDV